MRKSILIISLFLISIGLYSQEFKYYGGVFNSNELGIANIPVKLYSKRTSVYDITFPTYPAAPSYDVGTVVPSSDDVTHGPFPIGFTFNYFGVNYTQFYIGSNGWIGFSPGQTTGYTAMFVPNAGSPVNSILGDWEDLLPGSNNIYYSTTGTIPNRKLTVSFNNTPHYGCPTIHTFQFILYETSNLIDINYATKPTSCGNNATAGLIGQLYTTVVPVGGKNATQWAETNYSVRFTPMPIDTGFTYENTYLTNAAGSFTIASGLDINSYQFQVRIDTLNLLGLSPVDAQQPMNHVISGGTMNSKKWMLMDANGDSKVNIADSWKIYGKISGRFSNFSPQPNYRIFNLTDWNTIKNSLLDTRGTYPGTQTILINSPVNNATSNFYLIRTGYTQ